VVEGARPCVLLLAAPTTRTEFAARVLESDWLAKYAPGDGDPASTESAIDETWQDYRDLVGDPLRRLAEQAKEFPISVVRGATLADLSEATRSSEVVILFAHWKGFEIHVDDLLAGDSPARWLAAAERADVPMGHLLTKWLRREVDPPSLWRRLIGARPRPLIDLLTAALKSPDGIEAGPRIVDHVRESPLTAASVRRAILDVIFDGLLRPGNRLELYDGLHDCETIDRAIAPDFHGWLDLTTCTSTILADYLGSTRRHSMRLVQFDREQHLVWHAHVVGLVLPQLFDGGMNYGEARSEADAALRQALSGAAPTTAKRRMFHERLKENFRTRRW
jgi:hypothetical protein